MAASLRPLLPLALLAACAPDLVAIPAEGGAGDATAQADVASSTDAATTTDATAPADVVTAPPDVQTTPPDVVTTAPDVVTAPPDVVTAPDVATAPPDVVTAPPDASVGPVFNYAASGPNAVEVWNGPVPGTEGNARVFYPRGGGGARFPLVVFAHGFQLNVSNFDVLLRHVAAWGYVVASVDYPGTILGTDHRDVASAIRAARASFAMGRVSGFPAAASVDAARAVAMGHSLGGKAAIMAILDDAAFVAGVALDPVDDNAVGRVDDAHPSVAPERMGALRVPLALFGASQSRCGFLGQSCAPEASNWQTFARSAPSGARVATYPLLRFGHNDFVDTSCGLPCLACARGAAPLTTRELAVRALTVGFLERYTKDVRSAQAYVDGAVRDSLVSTGVLWDGSAPLPPCN
ncbi:MAG: hypothetical protein R3A48_02775 [Polyangiales bacterium]